MGSKKFYAVRTGKAGFKGVVHSWSECEKHVKGVSGAAFKKFSTLKEARCFVDETVETGAAPKAPASRRPSRVKGISKKKSATRGMSSVTAEALENSLVVYTDGACSGNGRASARAGYGVFFGANSEFNVSERLSGRPTNQRAEMTAVLVAMRVAIENGLVSPQKGLIIFTDSDYTLNGITKWINGWKRNKWKTAGGASDVKNKDIWEKLDVFKARYADEDIGFDLVWVKGHANNPGNEAADRLAVAGARKPLPKK